MSMLNPGKRGILTVIALMLIVGVPGIVAYADASDDSYVTYTEADLSTPYLVKASEGSLESVTTCDDGIYTVSFTTTALNNSFSFIYAADFTDVSCVKVYLDFSAFGDIGSLAVDVRTSSTASSVVNYKVIDYDGAGWYYIDYSATEQVSINIGSCYVCVYVVPAEAVAADSYSIDHAVYSGTSNSIFTDDVVELIVMVGGILLLICGTFALSFIDVDTPGKAVSYAKRGLKSAGKKMRRGKR